MDSNRSQAANKDALTKAEAEKKAAEKAAQDARIKKREEDFLRLSGEVEILNKGRDFIGKRRLW